ncbi:MAG: type I secretion system permease/ATPase [Robiginitomaculum sp.]
MAKRKDNSPTEVGTALGKSRRAFIGVGLFSAFINLLMLTGPLYMLQVYDRVLISHSMSTLVVLSIVMGALYIFMGFLEWIRSRVLVRIGNEIESDLSGRTFGVWMTQGLYGKIGSRNRPLDDLTSVKTFLSGPAPGALFDMPWAPFFIAVIWYLHWVLGVAALIGAIIIAIIAVMNEYSTRDTLLKSRQHLMQSRSVAEQSHRQSDSVLAMGMGANMAARWNASHSQGASLHTRGSDKAGGYSAVTKAFRMFVQSAILGLGCALAVVGEISPGAMIAGSIIMGRALAPIQMAIGQWRGFVNARGAYDRLNVFYDAIPQAGKVLQLPEPSGHIKVSNLFGAAPGSPSAMLKNINFEVKPGQAVGVLGPSASGKSTLARMLVGIWPAARGDVRLDGATYDQWDRDVLGPHIGYLPQDVELFDGTIGENIARFMPDASDEAIITAAKSAGVHEMILNFENGYKAQIGPQSGAGTMVLSGGQVQRIALARALFGEPKLIVLDEPTAHLDREGDAALTHAISQARRRGAVVIVMTHRPSAIAAVDHLLVLTQGAQVEFGPKDEVLKAMKMHSDKGAGGQSTTRKTQNTMAQNTTVRRSSNFSLASPNTLKGKGAS